MSARPHAPPTTGMERDRVTLRRARRAGLLTWVVVTAPVLVSVLVGGAGGRTALAVLLLGLTMGGLVASAWLLLAALLDLLADDPPGRGRLLWTLAVVIVTAVLPVLFLAAGG